MVFGCMIEIGLFECDFLVGDFGLVVVGELFGGEFLL